VGAAVERQRWFAERVIFKEGRVAELENIPEQIELQNQAVNAARSAIYTGAGWYVSLVLLIAVPYLWRKAL
jgi:hypothetical protein